MQDNSPIEIYLAINTILIGRESSDELQRIETRNKGIEIDIQQAFKCISNLGTGETLNIYLDFKTGASGILEQQVIPEIENKVNNNGTKIIKKISHIGYIGEHLFIKHLGENESGSAIVIYRDIIEIVNINRGKINYENGVSILSKEDGEFFKKRYDKYCTIEKQEATKEEITMQGEDTNPLFLTIEDFIARVPKEKIDTWSTENLLICPMFESEYGINDKEMQKLQALAGIKNITITI